MKHEFNSLTVDQEEQEQYSPENSQDSPTSGSLFNDTKTTSTLSSKRSKRSMQKRVISVPIKEIEGSRLKSEINAPPSDSWAWRKYGQKPIKGSPYPRGYYRCSSSKGCPARKQVERNRADPTMVIVTYSCDHNHPWPASRNNNHNHHHNAATVSPPPPTSTPTIITQEETSNIDEQEEADLPNISKQSITEPEFTSLEVGPPFLTTTDQYGWFSDLTAPSSTMLDNTLLIGDNIADADMTMIFSITEEDESLFADLGELPECSTVFRRREIINEEVHHRRTCNLAPWCGTKG